MLLTEKFIQFDFLVVINIVNLIFLTSRYFICSFHSNLSEISNPSVITIAKYEKNFCVHHINFNEL